MLNSLEALPASKVLINGTRPKAVVPKWWRCYMGQKALHMRDRLPSIHINVTDASRFLDEFVRIAEKACSLEVTRHTSGNYPVSLIYNDGSPLNKYSAHLVIEADTRIYIAVTIGNDDFSYENYCIGGKAIIEPLLRAYNRKERTRYRMTVTPKEKLRPKLPPASARLFAYFTAGANTSNLSGSDWRRFYEFVRGCRRDIPACDLHFLLVEEGFSEEYARQIVTIYEHICDFKRPRTVAETYDYYHVVRGLRWPTSGS